MGVRPLLIRLLVCCNFTKRWIHCLHRCELNTSSSKATTKKYGLVERGVVMLSIVHLRFGYLFAVTLLIDEFNSLLVGVEPIQY